MLSEPYCWGFAGVIPEKASNVTKAEVDRSGSVLRGWLSVVSFETDGVRCWRVDRQGGAKQEVRGRAVEGFLEQTGSRKMEEALGRRSTVKCCNQWRTETWHIRQY
ncbi:hypothetical protein AMECASPLE_027029 [Ameca splendens]|uniref:Uncharacterized protein n=1 Tax=Ameca splendens TaxID=208324 RepID=A0ABV0XI17_9TELE